MEGFGYTCGFEDMEIIFLILNKGEGYEWKFR